jgi:hypothetical protein
MEKKVIYVLIPVFILILIFGAALACGSSGSAKKVDSTATTAASSQSTEKTEVTETETTTAQIYNIGDSVQLKGAVITVKNFKKSNGSDFEKPKDGMEFVIVTVNVKNNSDDKISYNPFDYKMQNSKGQITDMAFTTVDSKTALSSGELAAGGEVEGTVAFEEPKDDSGLVLIYQSNFFNDNEIIKFNVK